MHKKYVRPTALEQIRIDAMLKGGCVLSIYRTAQGLTVPERGKIEVHHLVSGNKRMGHTYTIPLRSFYHRGVVPYPAQSKEEARELYGAALSDGSKSFLKSHGVDDLELWKYLQILLGMSTDLPPSKILPRREVSSEAPKSL